MKIGETVKEVETVKTLVETPIGCHPERSEGSLSFGNLWKDQRFFASLRMTNSVK